ncbi:hypothetical protein ACYCJ5_26825 [Klebsiella pneumoniae]
MKVLIKLSNDWPEHVSGNPVLDKWVHKIPWSGIECFLLYGCLLSIFDIKPFLVLTPSGYSLISSIINEVSSMCVCLKS